MDINKTSSNINIPRLILVVLSAIGVFFFAQFFVAVLVLVALQLTGLREVDSSGNAIGSDIIGDTSYWPKTLILSIIAGALVVGVFWVLKIWRETKPRKFLLLEHAPNPRQLFEVIATYGLYFLSLFLAVVLVSVSGTVDVEQTQELGIAQPEGIYNLSAVFVLIVVLPAISEEFLFRGFLYNSLKKYGGVGVAYVMTCVLFGAAHLEYDNLNWIAAIDTLIFSAFLIYISQRHRSLYSAILLHAIKNSIAFYALFVR